MWKKSDHITTAVVKPVQRPLIRFFLQPYHHLGPWYHQIPTGLPFDMAQDDICWITRRTHFFLWAILNFLPTGVLGYWSKNIREKIGFLDDICQSCEWVLYTKLCTVGRVTERLCYCTYVQWSQCFEDTTIKISWKFITQMHHFHFKASHPRKVLVKNSINDTEKSINLVNTL